MKGNEDLFRKYLVDQVALFCKLAANFLLQVINLFNFSPAKGHLKTVLPDLKMSDNENSESNTFPSFKSDAISCYFYCYTKK